MIGRAPLWGLAANGQAGVENVLDIHRDGINSALLGLGPGRSDRTDPIRRHHPPGLRRDTGSRRVTGKPCRSL